MGQGNGFSAMTSKAQAKEKTDKWNFIKISISVPEKLKKMKRQLTGWGKISANHIYLIRDLYSKYRELLTTQ